MKISDTLQKGVDTLKRFIKILPQKPGVYRMIDSAGDVLYVGKAKNLAKRVVSYTHVQKLPTRLQRMVSFTEKLEITITSSELEALLLENNLIKKYKPTYNILLKDDKSYPYIYFTDHAFPRVMKYRGKKDKKGSFFGPFADAYAVDEAILSIQRIFNLRNCSDNIFNYRKRPCLQYYIKRCSAPCVGKITEEFYKETTKQAADFLKGKTDTVQQLLSAKMLEASENFDYEKATQIRDRLKLLAKIHNEQRVDIKEVANADVVAVHREKNHVVMQLFFYRYGRNLGTKSIFLDHAADENDASCMAAFLKQFYLNHPMPSCLLLNCDPEDLNQVKVLLETHHDQNVKIVVPQKGIKKQLIDDAIHNAKEALLRKYHTDASMHKIMKAMQEKFDLEKIPERIEAYDNSHIQGSHPVGVMIVANKEGFDKKSYRKFKIQHERDFGGDDFAMMEEVLKRRFKHIEDWSMPDMLLIDGGIGQVNSVKKVCAELTIKVPIIGIAKGKDRNAGREHFIVEGREPFQLEKNDPLLHFLQRIRDESHRFAITTHRQKRIAAIKKSLLDDIPDVGPSRKKALLQHFGSAQGVKVASLKELENVKGIHKSTAQKIYDYFHE